MGTSVPSTPLKDVKYEKVFCDVDLNAINCLALNPSMVNHVTNHAGYSLGSSKCFAFKREHNTGNAPSWRACKRLFHHVGVVGWTR